MRHHTEDDEHFDVVDGKKVLKDGHRIRVSLMDAETAPACWHGVHDGHGRYHLVGHRPGFLVADATTRDNRRAYADYERELTEAYKNPSTCFRGTPSIASDDYESERHEREFDSEPYSESVGLRYSDGSNLEQLMHVHRQRMARLYDQIDKELNEAWRRS
jgi:hypothetical protein